jgi:hypothetical protein
MNVNISEQVDDREAVLRSSREMYSRFAKYYMPKRRDKTTAIELDFLGQSTPRRKRLRRRSLSSWPASKQDSLYRSRFDLVRVLHCLTVLSVVDFVNVTPLCSGARMLGSGEMLMGNYEPTRTKLNKRKSKTNVPTPATQ